MQKKKLEVETGTKASTEFRKCFVSAVISELAILEIEAFSYLHWTPESDHSPESDSILVHM